MKLENLDKARDLYFDLKDMQTQKDNLLKISINGGRIRITTGGESGGRELNIPGEYMKDILAKVEGYVDGRIASLNEQIQTL